MRDSFTVESAFQSALFQRGDAYARLVNRFFHGAVPHRD